MDGLSGLNLTSSALWGLAILLVGAWLIINLRYRPRASKEIDSFASLQAAMGSQPFTLVQFFAPL